RLSHEVGAALSERAMKQVFRQGRRHERADRTRSGGFSCYGDAARVAAESRNVLPRPSQRRDLIQQTIVARCCALRFGAQRGVREETKHAEAVIDGDNDRTTSRKPGTVVARLASRTGPEFSAVDPEEHGQSCGGSQSGSPDVQVKAVLALRGVARFK